MQFSKCSNWKKNSRFLGPLFWDCYPVRILRVQYGKFKCNRKSLDRTWDPIEGHARTWDPIVGHWFYPGIQSWVTFKPGSHDWVTGSILWPNRGSMFEPGTHDWVTGLILEPNRGSLVEEGTQSGTHNWVPGSHEWVPGSNQGPIMGRWF